MVVHIGINGFGRIGRIIFRTCFESSDLEVSAINDPAVDTDYICYLMKFDSTHGRFSNNLMFTTNEITIDGTKIKVFHEKLPSNIPWQTAGVQYVVEASGMFTNCEKASGHLASGSVKRVIVTAPSVDIPMMILGVNEEQINTEQKVISCASSTLYCLAPLVKVLEDNYGIAEGFITSIHAMTPSLKPLDGLCLRGKHWRDHRSILQNIIPAATGACKALGRIIPQVKNKMTGLAFRVPIVNVSVLDVTIRLNNSTTIEDIIKCIENESQSTMKNIMNTSSEEVVSSDFLGDKNSCILDKNSSLQLTPNFFKLICWYENEYSYACRVVDTIMCSEKCFNCEHLFNIRNNQFMSNRLFIEPNIPFLDEQIFIMPSYKLQNKSNLLLSMSQDNNFRKKQFKTTQACRIYECIHSGMTEDEHKNEIFEIWNDDIKDRQPKLRENIQYNNFCHSCVRTTPPDEVPRITNENEPDKDKAEFAKMTHKTNDILNWSIRQKYEVNFSEDAIEQTTENINCNRTFKSSPMSGDYVPCDNKFYTHMPETNTPKKDHCNSSESLSKYDFEIIESKLENDNVNKLSEVENKLNKNHILENEIIDKNSDVTYNEFDKLVTGDNEAEYKNIQILEDITNIEHTEIPLSNIKILSTTDNNDNQSDEIHDNNNSKGIELDEALNLHESTLNEMNEHRNDNIDIQTENHKILNMKKHLQKKILAGIVQSLSSETILNGNELTSLPAINSTNVSNTDRLGNISDIYDKLDSVSGSDSENSFQIKERKSQVLKVTDLTASLEDLARLDKICKIIEISDELSDKLFSVLDTNNPNFRRRNWSLKDLCERLKLDEFYNNVFGHSK
ncbi:protein PFC0760c-like [Vanessa tameamea]|uniref:Protein PFC0760c-like n=1 Tax=Vanessa tameamea TaxID=334116 RepID=A0ABM4AQS7_VANTA